MSIFNILSLIGGLAIVKHIAQVHNAKLSVISELDKGTTIEVKFN